MPPAAAAPFGGSGGQESQRTEILLQSSSTVAMLQSTAGPGPFVETDRLRCGAKGGGARCGFCTK